jgi:hypothetical protein
MTDNQYKKLKRMSSTTPMGIGGFFGNNDQLKEESDESDVSDEEEERIQKTIDFKSMMSKYREKTEFLQPFSKKVIEDVMFVNTKKVVALEYIYYQKNDADIHKIIMKKNYVEKHPLGIDDYLPLP